MSPVSMPCLFGSPVRRFDLCLALLMTLLLSVSALFPAAREAGAAGKGGRAGAPLKFEAPPIDLDAPEGQGETPAVQPPPANPARPGGTDGGAGGAPDGGGGAGGQAGTARAAKPIRLFGTVEFRTPIRNLPKWERVRNSEQARPSFAAGGLDARNSPVSEKWKALREKMRDASLRDKMKAVNNFFNQWPYKTDLDIWGVEDYWEVPREFVQKSGDCEGFAIAKYYGLRDLGVPAESLRVVAVKDSIRNLGHAVAVVFLDDDAYILDNLTGLVLSHKRLGHYKPQFSVNEQYLWRHVRPQGGPASS